jgi:hypothetical protein
MPEFELPEAILKLEHAWHIPVTESNAPGAERVPSQSRDVPAAALFREDVTTPQGPPLVNELFESMSPAERTAALVSLWQDNQLQKRVISDVFAITGQTNASGNVDIALYQVPMGFEAQFTRINIEAVGFTPAVPYTNAAAWAAIYRGLAFGNGAILDFAPASPGGGIFPGVWTDSATQAIRLRGGEWLSFHLVGSASVAATAIYCRGQCTLVEL